jgi:hypothetical protein
MVERLLFDRIDAEATGAAVGRQHDRTRLTGTDEAKPALTFVQLAIARAEIALYPTIIEHVPVPAANCRFHRSSPAFHKTLKIMIYSTRQVALKKNIEVDVDADVVD